VIEMAELKCREVRDLFWENYDNDNSGELSLKDIDTPLEKCGACVAEFEKYVKFMDEIRALPEPEMPSDFHEKLMEYVLNDSPKVIPINKPPVEKPKAKRKPFPFYKATAITAVAASLLVVFIWTSGIFNPAPLVVDYALPAPMGIMQFSDEPIAPMAGRVENNNDAELYDGNEFMLIQPTAAFGATYARERVTLEAPAAAGSNINIILIIGIAIILIAVCATAVIYVTKRQRRR
jgi:hypothetical protein